jgi:hypothetical protein
MVGDRQVLGSTTLQNAPDLYVTAHLGEFLKAEFAQDYQDLASGENAQRCAAALSILAGCS